MNCIIDKKNAQPLDVNLILNENAIFNLPRPHNGQVAYAQDTKKIYVYNNGWQVLGDNNNIKVEGKGLEMSLYNLNQSIISQLNTITDFNDKINLINEFKENTGNKYYMLYAKDISYFTIFHIEKYGEFAKLGDGVIECLKYIGDVKSIEYTEARDAIEIWIQQDDNDPVCAYLFPYDNGIVTVEEV
jgi:hypothetical protein